MNNQIINMGPYNKVFVDKHSFVVLYYDKL